SFQAFHRESGLPRLPKIGGRSASRRQPVEPLDVVVAEACPAFFAETEVSCQIVLGGPPLDRGQRAVVADRHRERLAIPGAIEARRPILGRTKVGNACQPEQRNRGPHYNTMT